eukprot:jgi/Ulvmu1/9247/UM005_0347.1
MRAAWLGGIRPALASLEFAHNGEERAMLGHHTYAPIATEAAGTIHLHLNVLVGGMPVQEHGADPGSPNPAERRAERLLAARLQQLSAKDSPEQFMSGLEIVRKNKSAYMKAAEERLHARTAGRSGEIPAGTATGIAMMAPASAGLLQPTASTLQRVGRRKRFGSGADDPSLMAKGILEAASASQAVVDEMASTSKAADVSEKTASTSEISKA